MAGVRVPQGAVHAFVELHIEQGARARISASWPPLALPAADSGERQEVIPAAQASRLSGIPVCVRRP